MARLQKQLEIGRCPHCNVDKPMLSELNKWKTTSHSGSNQRFWRVYQCSRCGGLIIAASRQNEEGEVSEMYPQAESVDDNLPEPAKRYLRQAIETKHSPDGSIILAASAVDAMLKLKGYKNGSLYERINTAAQNHLITEEMAKWAHQVRLDANEKRHADEEASIPTPDDAKRCIDFTQALAELLFILPLRVSKGIENSK